MQIGIHFGDFHPTVGGSYTYVSDLMRALAEVAVTSEHRFVILCDPAAADTMRLTVSEPHMVVAPVARPSRLSLWFAGLKYFSPVLRWVWRRPGAVEREARRHEVHLIWFVGVGAYECPNIPYIATILDLQHRCQPFFPEVSDAGVWDKREQFYGYFLRRAAFCITGTEIGKREIQYLYQFPEQRIRVFPLPTPMFALEAMPSKLDVHNRFKINRQFIFYPAQFYPHKNHANLLLALKWLKEQKGLEMVLALTGFDRGNLSFVRRFAEHQGVANQVCFLGFVSEEELVALYRQAVALTFVTYFGPDNIPPLEAFALGCPVIASRVEGAQEQYGDAAILVDPSNPEDIGQAIWNVYSDEMLKRRLVEAGLIRARKWSSKDYVGELFRLFDEFSAIRRNWL